MSRVECPDCTHTVKVSCFCTYGSAHFRLLSDEDRAAIKKWLEDGEHRDGGGGYDSWESWWEGMPEAARRVFEVERCL